MRPLPKYMVQMFLSQIDHQPKPSLKVGWVRYASTARMQKVGQRMEQLPRPNLHTFRTYSKFLGIQRQIRCPAQQLIDRSHAKQLEAT